MNWKQHGGTEAIDESCWQLSGRKAAARAGQGGRAEAAVLLGAAWARWWPWGQRGAEGLGGMAEGDRRGLWMGSEAEGQEKRWDAWPEGMRMA